MCVTFTLVILSCSTRRNRYINCFYKPIYIEQRHLKCIILTLDSFKYAYYDMPAESHEPDEPRSLQIKKANSTFNSEIYTLLPATCFFKKKYI